MKTKLFAISLLTAAAVAIAPVSPASAHGYDHHRHGFPLLGGLFAAAGAVVGGAALVATAPVRVIANAAEPYPYPQAYPAAPVYYAAPPAPVGYAYPPYGYPAPVTYAYPPQAYGYYR
jgi:hypothetical protein